MQATIEANLPSSARLALRVLAALLLVVCHAASAGAAPVDEANALITKANALRMAGDDLGSVPLLQQAYQINPGPRTAVHLGMAEYALGRWADADQHLTEALKSRDDPWIQKNQKQIVESLRVAKTHVSRIEITGDPPGAEVLINGKTVGRLPLAQPVAISAGSVDVELRAPGYQPGLRTFVVTGGQYQPVVIRLTREPGSGAGGTDPGRLRAGVPSGASPAVSVASDLEDAATGPRWRPIAIGISLGGAGLGLAMGGYGLWQYDRKATAFNNRGCFETKTGAAIRSSGSPDDVCKRYMTSYRGARVLQIAGFAAAGALTAAAAVAYLLGPDREPGASASRTGSLACAPALPHAGVGCGLRF